MIQKLPQDLINKIAAGEVVERPASVVKELVENALDAGATKIQIELEEGGMRLIRVKDNGSGMSKQDLPLALQQHATSKIKQLQDLFAIHTMGFRGEALASIAAVSKFELASLHAKEENGYRLSPAKSPNPIVHPMAEGGTIITVANLFYNVPARQKFLKTTQTELRHIVGYVNMASMVHPKVEFLLRHNAKVLLHYEACYQDARYEQVLGKHYVGSTTRLGIQSPGGTIRGRIAKPTFVHATHSHQHLFVNNRPVYDYLINKKVLEAYQTLVPRGYFPAFILHLDVPPEEVDVNVHPRKTEVRFQNPGRIFGMILGAIKAALKEASSLEEKSNILINERKDAEVGKWSQSQNGAAHKSPRFAAKNQNLNNKYSSQGARQQNLQNPFEFRGGIEERKESALVQRGWSIIAQIKKSYILVETAEGLAILDQHAVSEIINYNNITAQKKQGNTQVQQLLIPEEVHVTVEQKVLIGEFSEELEELGWSIDQFSDTSFVINAVPEILKHENIVEVFQEILHQLKDQRNAPQSHCEKSLILYEACRSAIMFGDELSLPEMEALLEQWLQTKNNQACEHGRPSVHYLGQKEMLKWFKR